MSRLSVRLEENVTAALVRARLRGADLTPAMQAIAVMMVGMTDENFEREASPLGVPWKASERVRRDGGKILVDTGDLRGSIRPDWSATHAAAGPEASGGAAIYARIHQLGGTIRPKSAKALKTPAGPRGSVTIPARPYLGFNDTMRRGIMSALRRHLTRGFSVVEGAV